MDPELGSLISALITVAVGMTVSVQSGRFKRWGWVLCFTCGTLIICYGTLGPLIGADLWSVWRLRG